MPSLPLQTARFTQLGTDFYTCLMPTPLTKPIRLGVINVDLANELGVSREALYNAHNQAILAGSAPMQVGEHAYPVQPFASVYSGHQFGVWAGQLGDGRAICIGESVALDGTRQEWQLKGAGRTPYSRFGDGRAVLRSSIREYLCSEAMHALGIPTTRALSLMVSDDEVEREEVEQAAVVTRISPSFIRFGHFEHFMSRGDTSNVQQLADFVIQHYYPEVAQADNPYAALFEQVLQGTAEMIAAWQAVGFCHGVMNTDNMSILGLTIDYGPYGFLDYYDAEHICNHSDHHGRYAYNQQPFIGMWNLVRLANCFVPFVDKTQLSVLLDTYPAYYEAQYLDRMRTKLGLSTAHKGDASLVADLMVSLQPMQVDFTLFFRKLALVSTVEGAALPTELMSLFKGDTSVIQRWLNLYIQRLRAEGSDDSHRAMQMNQVNPLYVLRNYLLQTAIEQAEQGDFSEVERLYRCLQNPFSAQTEFAHYAALPPVWASEICVSCSS